MAVKIQQYQERLTPSGFGAVPTARGVPVSDAIGQAMQQFGGAAQQYAGVGLAMNRREQEQADAEFRQQEEERLRKLEAKQTADAMTEAGKRVSIGNLEFQTWYNDAAKNAGDDFPMQVQQKWIEVSTRILDGSGDEKTRLEQAQAGMEPDYGIRNSSARTNAERSLTQLGEHYISGAMGIAAKAGLARRRDNLETIVSENERAVAVDPRLYDKLRADTMSIIQNDPTTDVENKLSIAREFSLRLTNAALMGAIAKGEGEAVKSAIMKRFGAEPLSSDERQGIIATGNQAPVRPEPDINSVQGMVTPGNIDLANRPQIKNKDGSISTVSSFSVNIDGKEVLLTPITEDGKVLSQDQAVEKYKKDGKHLGIFETPAAASAYAEQLHQAQDRYYNRGKSNVVAKPLPPKVARWSSSVEKQASAHGIDATIMLWQIKEESAGDPNAQNDDDKKRTGDPSIGLSQFQPKTAAQYGIDPKDPEQAIKGQAMYMRDLLKMFDGNYQKALAGYNWGQGNLEKAIAKHGDDWMQHAPKSVQNYVANILNNAGKSGAQNTAGGVSAAGGVTMEAAVNPTLMNIVNRLPQDRLIPMLHAAQTEVNRQMATYQSALETREASDLAAFGVGESVDRPLALGEYQKVYGAVRGTQRYEEYAKAQQLGLQINAVRTMTIEQQQVLLQGTVLNPNLPNYQLQVQRRQVLEQAIDRVNQARAADPMTYAMQVKIGNVKPIDWNKVESVNAELPNRVGVASTMNQSYGAPMMLLSKQEAANLSAGMNNMTAQEKMRYLGVIRSAVKDQTAYRSIMQQIAPDSVVTAMAGIVMTKEGSVEVSPFLWGDDDVYKPQQVAQLMLEGEAILNPTKTASGQDGKGGKYPLPKESDFMSKFSTQVGNAFAGNPTAYSAAMQGVKAYYVGKAAREGDLSDQLDRDRFQEAINAVTGGVTSINGSNVIRPWGMPDDIFKDRAKVAFEGTIKAKGMVASYGGVTLQNYGDGSYLVRSGTDFLRGPDGAPVVIDVVTGTAPAAADSQTLPTTPGKTKEAAPGKLKTR